MYVAGSRHGTATYQVELVAFIFIVITYQYLIPTKQIYVFVISNIHHTLISNYCNNNYGFSELLQCINLSAWF